MDERGHLWPRVTRTRANFLPLLARLGTPTELSLVKELVHARKNLYIRRYCYAFAPKSIKQAKDRPITYFIYLFLLLAFEYASLRKKVYSILLIIILASSDLRKEQILLDCNILQRTSELTEKLSYGSHFSTLPFDPKPPFLHTEQKEASFSHDKIDQAIWPSYSLTPLRIDQENFTH